MNCLVYFAAITDVYKRQFHSHLVVSDRAVLRNLQRVAEKCRPAQLFHERLCELLERVADDDDLSYSSQLVEEFLCTCLLYTS